MTASSINSVSSVAVGNGGLPKLTLLAADGARAEVYLYGAHMASWAPAGGRDHLFLSRLSAFRAGAPVRGGVPVVFPQFGTLGSLPLHGLARLMDWELAGTQAVDQGATATLRLADNTDSRARWDHSFAAELEVSIARNTLSLALTVANTGDRSFDFTAAFHTYLAVSDIRATAVEGLAGLRYRDAAAGGIEARQDEARVGFAAEVNRIYFDAPAEAHLVEADRTTRVQKSGFPDVVVWNPGAEKCATMADLEPEDYRRFVCIEAAAVGKPIELAPGARWQGTQTLVA